jgi:hypothetical protein
MAHLQFTDVQGRPTEFLDLTSLTLDEFQQLSPPFEVAFQARMAAWCLDGKPRTARQFAVYKNCPLPTPEDRLFFILTYLKTYSLQVVQGRLFGMRQSKANQLNLSRLNKVFGHGKLASGAWFPIEAPHGHIRVTRRLEGRDQLLKLVKRHARAIQKLHRARLQLGKPYTSHGSFLLSP